MSKFRIKELNSGKFIIEKQFSLLGIKHWSAMCNPMLRRNDFVAWQFDTEEQAQRVVEAQLEREKSENPDLSGKITKTFE